MIVDINLNPSKGSETKKIRPCIIVTNNHFNAHTPVVQIVPITAWSEKKNRIKTNIELYPDGNNGLTKRSVADCLQTRAIDLQSRIIRQRGSISIEDVKKLDAALKAVFALD